MRIAVMGSRGYPSTYGGFETFVREFVPRAVDAGHELVVYCRESPNGKRSWSVDGALCRLTRGIDDHHLSTLSYGLSSAWDVRRSGIDVALVLNTANGFWLPLIRSAGVPVALNVDGLEWERDKWNRLGRAVFKAGSALSARQATRLIADSRAIAGIWHDRYGVRPDFIPYGANVLADDGDDELIALGIIPGEYVLTVARLVPENNVMLTLDALGGIDRRSRPSHVIVGSGYGSRLHGQIAEIAAGRDEVRMLGHVSNQRLLSQLYRHCRVYVHGHSVGGTNPSLLQALGSGAPVLAYDAVFNREVIGDTAGLYYSDSRSLVDQLDLMLNSQDLSDVLAESAQARIAERYQWDEVCDRYLEVLSDLAGERGAGRPLEPVAA